MRIHIAYIQGAYLRDYEKTYVPQMREELRKNGQDSGLIIEENPSRADVIILWEGFEYKTPKYIDLLENDPLIRNHADRVYTINYDDHPEGFLAGIYTSLEDPFFNSSIHRIWPFFTMNNPVVYGLARDEVLKGDSKFLFSFTGAASHTVRNQLFKLYPEPTSEFFVKHINKWYDHGEEERLKFAQVALGSVFCLCPHGYCSYTPRITEVMAMARVPVIIADDWIPFSFEEKIPYYIKIPEADISRLPEILRARRSEAEELRQNARMLWEKYCSLERRVVGMVEVIVKLNARTYDRMSYEDYRGLWRSKDLMSKLGWTFGQQAALRVEQHARRWFPAMRIPGVSSLMRYRNAPNLK
jgi:hypothetical protein